MFALPDEGDTLSTAAELFASELKPKPAPFVDWLKAQPADVQELYEMHRKNAGMSNAGLVRITKALNGRVGKDSISEWRRG